jgi:Raf kinase inhibitor-like YbhB/YbcL family protein
MTHGIRLGAASVFCFALSVALAISASSQSTERTPAMQLTTSAFKTGEAIPAKHTCDGQNLSPAFKWTGTPANAKALALIADDPDAPGGTWVHWVLFDVPPNVTELPEGIEKSQFIPSGAKQGLNDFRHLGYGGPCPPHGKPHRYFFKLYALDKEIGLKPGASRKEVEKAMEKHILAEAALMGTYQRK